ncbi:unnamed protein product [Chrysoparadoxa australica]
MTPSTSLTTCRSSSSTTSSAFVGHSPPASSRPVAAWLLGTSGAVAVMVTVGGVTRLTKSGLSMTDWKLQGSLPPSNQEEWEAEFERYKSFPEYQQRKGMALDEFKFIFWWEYCHRMLGRCLGVIYGVPLLYFAATRAIPRHVTGKVFALLGLGGAQGLVGWWMVKSGLDAKDPQGASTKEIRVSPYRLATHLGMAFTTYCLLVHTGLEAFKGPAAASSSSQQLSKQLLKQASKLRGGCIATGSLAFFTAMSGAFVAGNDAGHAYNLFPKMTQDTWLPPDIMSMTPRWRNFFEETATVQADHRVLAMTTLTAVSAVYIGARRAGSGALWRALPLESQLALNTTMGIMATQVGLGISTLLLYVPIPLAAAHQAGALALMGSSVWLASSLRWARLAATKVVP